MKELQEAEFAMNLLLNTRLFPFDRHRVDCIQLHSGLVSCEPNGSQATQFQDVFEF